MATVSSAPPVDVKTAVKIATRYFNDLFQHPFTDLAVEEVELSDDRQAWRVTLGYVLTDPGLPAYFGSNKSSREFKVITIDAQTGEPTSMKIKKF